MIKKITFVALLFILSSFTAHKFYVSINQIEYKSDKKEVQITARYFIDDLNNALEKMHNTKFYLESKIQTTAQEKLLTEYLHQNFSVKINSNLSTLKIIDKELEDDVLIFYIVIEKVSKIKTLEIKNTMLFDFSNEQQNIIHSNINGIKKSILYHYGDKPKVLKF